MVMMKAESLRILKEVLSHAGLRRQSAESVQNNR
jgi:hypothetical protein